MIIAPRLLEVPSGGTRRSKSETPFSGSADYSEMRLVSDGPLMLILRREVMLLSGIHFRLPTSPKEVGLGWKLQHLDKHFSIAA